MKQRSRAAQKWCDLLGFMGRLRACRRPDRQATVANLSGHHNGGKGLHAN
ncbi:MAG: hypothetical protein NVS4B11_12930 [Ktedonobacteraceae bacterium]